MSEPPVAYYTDERWQNWLDRLGEADLDPEDEDAARLLWNLQEDATIAVTKIIDDHAEGDLDDEDALSELAEVREIVLSEVDIEDEETHLLVDGVQTSLVCVFYAAELSIVDGTDDTAIEDRLDAASNAEEREAFDDALEHCARAGTSIIDGATLEPALVEEVGYGPVAEWLNGLGSLESALSDPERIEEDEEAA